MSRDPTGVGRRHIAAMERVVAALKALDQDGPTVEQLQESIAAIEALPTSLRNRSHHRRLLPMLRQMLDEP